MATRSNDDTRGQPLARAELGKGFGTTELRPRHLVAAETVEKEGVSAMVLDPRTLVPLDKEGIARAVQKTNRVVIVEEGCKTGGVGAEISAVINEEAFDYLDAPVGRVAAHDVPIPFSPPMEDYVLPNEQKIVDAVRKVLEGANLGPQLPTTV